MSEAVAIVDWKKKRKKRLIQTSASQFETYNLCRRKWWLDKVRKLYIPSSGAQGFGTVLHACVERWMLADDLGRDDKGKPVEIYPQGWHHAFDKFTGTTDYTCTIAEQDIIKKLITVAIEEGVIERLPGRMIERQFNRTIMQIKCPDCGGGGTKMIHRPDVGKNTYVSDGKCETCKGDGKGTTITITGYIDVETPDQIQDHKTTKNMKWAKSANKLRENIQMLIYAKEHLMHLEDRGEPLPPSITVRHNVFCKDPQKPKVRKTFIEVSVDEINKNWERITKAALDMDALRRTCNDWKDVPEPANLSTACNAYGGCPFLSICTTQESMEMYEKRLAQKYGASDNGKGKMAPFETTDTPPVEKGSPMNAFQSKLAEKTAAQAIGAGQTPAAAPAINPTPPATQAIAPVGQQPAVAAAAPAVAATPATQPAVAPATTPAGKAPPWASPDCGACMGIGFNTKGTPCRICDIKAQQVGKQPSNTYLLSPVGDGTVYWQSQTDDQISGTSPLPVQTPAVEAEVRTDPVPAAAPAAEPAAQPAEQPAAEQAAQPAEQPAEQPATAEVAAPAVDPKDVKTAGRPKKGFILCVNCAPVKGILRSGSGRGVIHLSEVLASYGAKLAEASGVASYYILDAFSRRDALAAAAFEISNSFGTDMVIAHDDTPDMKVFIEALRPLAGMEIVASR